jgi:hypothetical protein
MAQNPPPDSACLRVAASGAYARASATAFEARPAGDTVQEQAKIQEFTGICSKHSDETFHHIGKEACHP